MRFAVGAGGIDDDCELRVGLGIAVGTTVVDNDGGNVGTPGKPGGSVAVAVGLGCVVAVGKIGSGTGVGVGMINAQPVTLIVSKTKTPSAYEKRIFNVTQFQIGSGRRPFPTTRYRVNRLRICGTP